MHGCSLPKRFYVCCTLALWLLLLGAHDAGAAILEETLPSGLKVQADFRPGDPERPAVLVVHGFMTTYNFNTVRGIADLLAENGYTVLAPTLSLGINGRLAGIPCDAVHTHTMEQSLDEIGWWVEWLTRRGYQDIVLIGHSSGATQALLYAAGTPHTAVRGVIAVSLIYLDYANNPALVQQQRRRAQSLQDKGDQGLNRYTILFCKDNFIAPAKVYLSYAMWDAERLLSAVRQSKIPVDVIRGSEDAPPLVQWGPSLQAAGAHEHIIEEAGHFFDGFAEFELHDRILTILDHLPLSSADGL